MMAIECSHLMHVVRVPMDEERMMVMMMVVVVSCSFPSCSYSASQSAIIGKSGGQKRQMEAQLEL